MSTKQAINDKLQGSVATYLRCGRVANNQIKIRLLLSVGVEFFFSKSVNIWQSYKQERDCFVHFFRLLSPCWPSSQRARDNHVLACNFAKYLPIYKFFSLTLSSKPFLIWLLTTIPHLKYVATLHYNLSLMACCADINVSQGSVETLSLIHI